MTVFENIAFGLRARRCAEGGDQAPRREREPRARPGRAARAQAAPALRRPAPARRDGSRDRARATGLPDGRAALEPRRAPARADARGGRARAARAGRDDDLRHARPGRGDDDGRPRRRDAQRRAAADRRSAGSLRPAGEPLRRELHRQPADEPRPGAARGERRRSRRPASASRRSAVPAEMVAERPACARTPGARSASGSGRSTCARRTATAPRRLRGTIRATEALGSEFLVHLEVAAEPVLTEEVREVAGDVDAAALQRLESEAKERRTVLIARLETHRRPGRRRADRGRRRHAAAPLLRPRQRDRDLRLGVTVLTVGESMALLDPLEDGELRLGMPLTLRFAGAESNFAIALARLGDRRGVGVEARPRSVRRPDPRRGRARRSRHALGAARRRSDRALLQVALGRADARHLPPRRLGCLAPARRRRAGRGARRRRRSST